MCESCNKYPNIDAERGRNQLSITAFCEKIGICRRTYYNWLKRGNIPQRKLEVMADLFGTSVDYLLDKGDVS